MTPGKRPWRRRNYIINRPFQVSFILRAAALAFGILAVVYGANLLFFYNLAQTATAKGIPRSHIFFRFVDQQQETMNQIFLVAAILIFGGICTFGLLYSHRIAGPLYRLTQHLKGLAAGQAITEVRFRKGDYFLEIATAFNDFLRSRVQTQQSEPAKVDAEAGKATDAKVS